MIADGLVAGAVLPRKEDRHHPRLLLAGGPRASGKVELDVQRRVTSAERSRVLPRALTQPQRDEAVDRQGARHCPFLPLALRNGRWLRLGWQTRGGTVPTRSSSAERKKAPGLGGGAPSPEREAPGRSSFLLLEAPPASVTGLGRLQCFDVADV